MFLAACLLLSTACVAFSGCKGDDTPQSSTPNDGMQTEQTGYLALNQYSVNLLVGETFDLNVLKIEEGKSSPIEKLTVISEADKIVGVDGKKLTALQAGETYVQIKADGYSVACFVTVSNPTAGTESVIRVNDGKLYNGVAVQAYAYLFNHGQLSAKAENVAWEIVGEGSITEDGVITPTAEQTSLTVKASFSVKGAQYQAEQTFEVAKPYYYAPSKTMLRVAAPKTVSGADNKKDCVAEFSVKLVDIFTQAETTIDDVEITCQTSDESLIQVVEKSGADNVFQVIGKSKGEATASLVIDGEYISLSCDVATPVATIRDMDLLSEASLNNTSLLSQSYILVSDLDYNGEVILPIATYGLDSSTNRTVGYQWKHWLKKTANGYAVVERGQQGKEGTITDNQFREFSAAKGINPGSKEFSGVFDGNGYAIKNGLIFYGSIINPKAGSKVPVGYADGVFGKVTGTIRNVGFENLKMQNPTNFTDKTGPYDITKALLSHMGDLGGKGVTYDDDKIGVTDDGKSYLRGGTIVARSVGATIENVYAEIAYDGFVKDSGYVNAGLVLWESDDSKLINNAVKVTGEGADNFAGLNMYVLQSQGSTAANAYCNLAIGGRGVQRWGSTERKVGENGNYWKQVGDWVDLTMVASDSTAENRMSYDQSIATFDTSVWKFENYKPTLINKCLGNTDLT